MKPLKIYQRALNGYAEFETDCTAITSWQWDTLMDKHTKANKKIVAKVAHLVGILSSHELKAELKRPYYNPYTHYKTKTHLIYVHSGIEHFIKIY